MTPPIKHTLEIKNLHARVIEGNKKILQGVDLVINSGEIHAIMGPNGSGKSTLCNILMGHPKYEVSAGEILFNGENILEKEPNERAALGLFSSFQQPLEIPGITLTNFLRTAKNAIAKERAGEKETHQPIELENFVEEINQAGSLLKLKESFLNRSVNQGFSGGERKRAEIVQMAILKPYIAFLDEIDSGLDIDALKTVAEAILNIARAENTGVLLITHYQRILNYIEPHHVHIIHNGKIIKSGDKNLAHELEKEGYSKYIDT